MELQEIYSKRYFSALLPIAENIQQDLLESFKDVIRIDRISTRAKSIDRFIQKANKIEDGKIKYSDPLNQIQDQIGARIITFYLEDVDFVCNKIKKYYRYIEQKDLIPETEKEFGYTGKHFILVIQDDMIPEGLKRNDYPPFFELQIKTLFQHAFSEASHDLAYKPTSALTKEQKRKVAFTAAQSWGADMIFAELFKELSIQS